MVSPQEVGSSRQGGARDGFSTRNPKTTCIELQELCSQPQTFAYGRSEWSTVWDVRIRLKDVAALAGVSEATVSRVMNRKDGVAPSTKAEVLRVLTELGYEPPGLHGAPRADRSV